MKREWWLASASALLTLLLGLGLIRWLAPGLLGLPADVAVVRLSKEVPAFYDNVFRKPDYRSPAVILKDPIVKDRAKPMYPESLDEGVGPNDLLGFRNRGIPNVADIIAIGDSQTYGNNVILTDNWPSRLRAYLADRHPVVYSMATGGWGAIQYLDMFAKSAVFRPRLVIVAFYTGNDAYDSFVLAYGVKRWAFLRPDTGLDLGDAPAVRFPPARKGLWHVRFADGVETVFSPAYRLSANRADDPAIRAGYAIMWKTARLMAHMAEKRGIHLIFTIIPTKELVYARKIERAGLDAPPAYHALIAAETGHIETLAGRLRSLSQVHYVDLVSPLQQAALTSERLYPGSFNGHPTAEGYDLIAREIARAADGLLPVLPPEGALRIRLPDGRHYRPYLIRNGRLWVFESVALAVDNGWDIDVAPLLDARDIATMPLQGWIGGVNPARFGPRTKAP